MFRTLNNFLIEFYLSSMIIRGPCPMRPTSCQRVDKMLRTTLSYVAMLIPELTCLLTIFC